MKTRVEGTSQLTEFLLFLKVFFFFSFLCFAILSFPPHGALIQTDQALEACWGESVSNLHMHMNSMQENI